MKTFSLIFFGLFLSICYSQNPKAVKLYNEGVVFYNQKEYRKADSLFTASLKLSADKDTYFSRALCNGKTGDKAGYCEDLMYAGMFGEEKALNLFKKTCGKIDTTYVKLDQNYTKTVILSKVITFKTSDTAFVFKQKYSSQQSSATYSATANSPAESATVATEVEKVAEFPGGTDALTKFIRANTGTPPWLRERREERKVLLRFTVFEDGTLHDIMLVEGIANCPECNEEAMRVIAIMPAWSPAKMNGRPVKCYFNIPVKFGGEN